MVTIALMILSASPANVPILELLKQIDSVDIILLTPLADFFSLRMVSIPNHISTIS